MPDKSSLYYKDSFNSYPKVGNGRKIDATVGFKLLQRALIF